MFAPHYRITDHCLSLIQKTAEVTAKLDQTNIAFPLMARLQKEALNRNAHSSTSIEGNTLSLAQVSVLSDNRPAGSPLKGTYGPREEVHAGPLPKREVANYLAALRWIVKNYHWAMTEKRLLQLHAIVVKGLIIDAKAGAYKTKQNYVVDAKKRVVFTPPAPRECPKLMRELITWVQRKSGVHPVIMSAVFHHQCLSIHPFSDGNGRLARCAAQWILYQRKFDPKHILSLDDFYASDRERYYEKIQQARDLDYDLTYWVEYVAQGVLETIGQVYARASSLSLSSAKKIIITPRQEELVELLNSRGILSSRDIGRLLKINRARVNQLVSPLNKAGIVVTQGSARATRYYLKKWTR